jgi:hypothetical protein
MLRGLVACLLLFRPMALAAPKPHVVAFGKWTTVKWWVGEDERAAINMKIRALFVDGQTKEFTTGPHHDVTDRTFVVQRIFRLNDSLSQETGIERWRWERGGWLLVNRISGKVQQVPLTEFDPYSSEAAWFRDYAAYCGLSDDGKKASAIIVQLGRRKPILKKPLADSTALSPEPGCPAPVWERTPSRVTFDPKNEQKFTFKVPTRAVDAIVEDDPPGEE